MFKSYKYRLLPTEDQKAKLDRHFGSCRFIYNLGLETKIAAWQSNRVNISSYALMKQMTELINTDCLWLKECNYQSLESSLANLDKAYQCFFKGAGFPKFKSKSGRQSVHFRQGSKIIGSKVSLWKIGHVEFVKHRELFAVEIKTVTVSKTTTNKYFVSILVDTNINPKPKVKIEPSSTVGIDLGIKSFAVLSDGTKYDGSNFSRIQQNRLRVEQRKLSRRYKPGNNDQSKSWHKQRLIVALLHENIANQRSDFLHKLSNSITKNFDTICLEDLNVAGMIKNRSLSKSISDASWGQFYSFLEYKAVRDGKNILYINRFSPSSKTCSECGDTNNNLKLSDRNWICKSCGVQHDRDLNAAINIKKLGLEAKPSTANVGQKVKRIG